jgi:hypothetical protein
MKTYKFKGKQVTVKVVTSMTPNRIQLTDVSDGSPFAIATSNIPALNNLEGYVAVKNYSENEGMLDFLIENNIVEAPITYVQENYVSFPICKLK